VTRSRLRWRDPVLPGILSLTLAVAIVTDAGASTSPRVASPRASSYVQVTQVEYHLLLSRGVVKAGPVNLQEIDGGMDMHDLDLRYGTSPTVIAEPLLNPGQRYNTVVYLRPGTYHLWCSLPGHWKLGMHAILKVVK
jgi:uncharacterized cupredoxin-like copper-binding protein